MLFVSPSDIVFFNKLLTSVRLKIPAQNELLHPFANVPQIHGGHAAKTAKKQLKTNIQTTIINHITHVEAKLILNYISDS